MKKYLVLFLILISYYSKSQVLLGKSKQEVSKQSVYHTGVIVKDTGGHKAMISWDGDNKYIFGWAYFFTDNICNACVSTCDYKTLNTVISNFNETYQITSDSTWINNQQKNIYIMIAKGQYFYTIFYTLKY